MLEEAPSIGVFLCDCGGEISNIIDYDHLTESTSRLMGVKFVKRHSFLCGEEGRREIEAAIHRGVERLVVAACSPKLYEALFRRVVKDGGLNPFCLEMVNIREQCAWPHRGDLEGAGEKARRIIAAAVERARRISPIERKRFEVDKSVLVIGGGVSGLQAAIDVADFGYKVQLVEKAPIIGGNALKLGLAFPTDDGAFCISSPNFLKRIRKCFYRASLLQHPNIKLYTLSEVKEVKGSFGNFEVKVISKPRGVREDLCINCGRCLKVCPIEVVDEMNYGLSKRKAIYLPYPNAVPPAYVIDFKNCNKCGKCVDVCPTEAINLADEAKEFILKAGAIIIATGFEEYDPAGIKQYKYGLYNDVITQLQLARILDSYGPTRGRLVRPSDGQVPRKIVMVQCVGSRDEKINPYCSKVCCTLALKHAKLIKERYVKDAEIYICYMDIRTAGKDYEEYFSKAREAGISFIRGKPSEILRNPADGSLIVEVEDTLSNKPLEIEADMVVLSVGLVPTRGSGELAKILSVEVGEDGFIKEVYPKLKPVETKVKGIYVCGGAHGPKDIPESITQAEASALRAILDLSRGSFEKDMDVAYVNEKDCVGCELCVEICPYNSIKMVEVKEGEAQLIRSVARINEFSCEGCGSCASRCPTGAIELRHYTDSQVLSQLHELLAGGHGPISPMVIAFCCDECGYAAVDLAGMGGMTYPPNVLTVRVPCLGWVSLYHIFKAFEYGAEGILLVGCLRGSCQHLKGDVYSDRVTAFAKLILDEIGLGGERLKIIPICAADPIGFSVQAESFVNEVMKLKPIPRLEAC